MAAARDKYHFTIFYEFGEGEKFGYDIPVRSFQVRWGINAEDKLSLYISAVFGDGAQSAIVEILRGVQELSGIIPVGTYIYEVRAYSSQAYLAIKYGENYILGVYTPDGTTVGDDAFPITGMRYDEGSENFSITITSRKVFTNPPRLPVIATTDAKLSYRSYSSGEIDSELTLRFSAIDWDIRPKDTIGFYNEGDSITVDKINIIANNSTESMQLSGTIVSGGEEES